MASPLSRSQRLAADISRHAPLGAADLCLRGRPATTAHTIGQPTVDGFLNSLTAGLPGNPSRSVTSGCFHQRGLLVHPRRAISNCSAVNSAPTIIPSKLNLHELRVVRPGLTVIVQFLIGAAREASGGRRRRGWLGCARQSGVGCWMACCGSTPELGWRGRVGCVGSRSRPGRGTCSRRWTSWCSCVS